MIKDLSVLFYIKLYQNDWMQDYVENSHGMITSKF